VSTDDLPITVAWFDTAEPNGPAFGDPETTSWDNFTSIFQWRREGSKDGCCFILLGSGWNLIGSRFAA
jgi:hypothetical protein